MSRAEIVSQPATLADYEVFIEQRSNDERWELIDGVIEMTTNPRENHEQIVGGIYSPLRAAMNLRGCRVYAGGTRVQRSNHRDEDMATLPDLVVRCDPRTNATFITDPLVVVEVLSCSTTHKDRGPKFGFYKSLSTLQHIVLVDQDLMRVEHYRRATTGWSFVVLRRPSDRLVLDAVDFSVDLDTIYFDVPVLRPAAPPEGYEDDVPILIP